MTIKLKNLLIALPIVAAMAVLGVSSAFAADLNWDANTVVVVNGDNYTIRAPSGATTMEIAATTLTVTVPSGSTFNLVSFDRFLLTNDQSVSQQCSGSENVITITGPLTVVVTPNNGSTCTATGTGSGGGGGSSWAMSGSGAKRRNLAYVERNPFTYTELMSSCSRSDSSASSTQG